MKGSNWSGVTWGTNRKRGFPFLSMRNFSKFQRMSETLMGSQKSMSLSPIMSCAGGHVC